MGFNRPRKANDFFRISAVDQLVDMRRLGQTKLYNKAGADSPAILFSYVHLRAPLPSNINPEIFGSGSGSKPEAYFLMRRSKDGFVSSTGMFKASFPMATKAEEDAERRYVKAKFHTSLEETAGNLWIHPEDAVALSSDYNCRVWIEALVDNKSVLADSRSRAVTPPPPFRQSGNSASASASVSGDSPGPNAAAALSESERPRSASPHKKRRAGRSSKHNRKGSSSLSQEVGVTDTNVADADEVSTTRSVKKNDAASESDGATHKSSTEVDGSSNEDDVKEEDNSASDESNKDEHGFTVEVDKSTETNGDIKVESTHVKVEFASPDHAVGLESPEEMIAKAKEMVAEAMKAEENAESGVKSKSKKRKVEDMKEPAAEDGEAAISTEEHEERTRSKRTKLLDAAVPQRFRKPAIIGLGATIAIGYASVILSRI